MCLIVTLRMWLVQSRVFFLKQKTAYELRISDWSTDVCSSDLWCRCDSAAGLRRPKGMALRSDICAPRERPGAQGTCRMDSRCVRQRIGGIVPGVRVHRLSQPL